MSHKLAEGQTKAAFVSDVLNKTLYTLITNCTKADGVRDYFHIGVIVYSRDEARNGFAGELGNDWLNPISSVANNPFRIEERLRKVANSDEKELPVKFPIWFLPYASGNTSMCRAFTTAIEVLTNWSNKRMRAFPPTVLHITDGHPTDGDPEPLAKSLGQVVTEDGPCLIYNLHVDIGEGSPIVFPDSPVQLPDRYSARLFRMSSKLPPQASLAAREKGLKISDSSKGFIFNASPEAIVDFFDIGTRPATALK